MLRRKRVLAAKIESVPGTAESLAGTDAAFNIYNPMIQPNFPFETREGQGGFGYLPSVVGGKSGTATFRTMLEWDGSDTEPSWADTFFPACGWVKSGGTYTPRTEAPGSNVKTLTIGVYADGKLRRLAGCMGSFVVTLPTGRPGFIDWTFTGAWVGETDQAIITPTYPTALPMRFASGAAELNDVVLRIESATINSGNEVVLREDPATDSGFFTALVTNRRPTVTLNPESVTVATQDRMGILLASTEYALELDVGGPEGTSSDAVLSFDAPKAQIINNQEGDRNAINIDQLEMQCNKNGATHDQELSIVFTPLVNA